MFIKFLNILLKLPSLGNKEIANECSNLPINQQLMTRRKEDILEKVKLVCTP